MSLTILKIFEAEARALKIDSGLVKKVVRYVARFVNKNDDNLQFLGSPLTGVYPFRFASADNNEWFDDVLEMDDLSLQNSIKEHFKDPSNDFSPTWKVSSNVTNLSFVWLAHKFLNSKSLSKRDKATGVATCIKMLQYKMISSIDSNFFKYPANSEVASAAYAGLSKKFLLKKHGSWAAVVEVRTEDIIADDSIHRKALDKMDNDEDVIYMLNDIHGRHKSIYIGVTSRFYDTREMDSRVQSISSTIELQGEITVKDKRNSYGVYRTTAHNLASTTNSFIRKKAVDAILTVVHTAPEKATMEALEWMSSNYGAPRLGYIKDFVEDTIVFSTDFIRKNEFQLSDLPTILVKLRGVHLASKQSDETVLRIRELGTKIVEQSVSSNNSAVHAAVRAAITLYVVLRVLAKDNL